MTDTIPMPLREDERAELVRLRAVADEMGRPFVEMATELAYLRTVAGAARVLVKVVVDRRRRGWHRTPLGEVIALAKALQALEALK